MVLFFFGKIMIAATFVKRPKSPGILKTQVLKE